MIAALTMHEWTDDDALSDLFRSSALALRESLEYDPELGVSLWTQHLYGSRSRLLGAVHGFAGNVFPIIRGRNLLSAQEWDWWRGQIVRTIVGTAIREGGPNRRPRQLIAKCRHTGAWPNGASRPALSRRARQRLCIPEAVQENVRPDLAGTSAGLRDARHRAVRSASPGVRSISSLTADGRRRVRR